jgi:NAD(P) transhydrogenase
MSKEFIDAEMALFMEQCKDVDIVITTVREAVISLHIIQHPIQALIPGKPAPKLITNEMVAAMKQGSVIVDMAAEAGGNCEATRPGELHVHRGVTVVGQWNIAVLFYVCLYLTGYTDLPSRLPTQSSTLYSNNITKFLLSLGGDGKFAIDLEDEVVRGSIVLHHGQPLPALPRPIPVPVTPPPSPVTGDGKPEVVALTPWQKATREVAVVTAGMGGVVALGKATGTVFMDNFFTFGLAGLIGYR